MTASKQSQDGCWLRNKKSITMHGYINVKYGNMNVKYGNMNVKYGNMNVKYGNMNVNYAQLYLPLYHWT